MEYYPIFLQIWYFLYFLILNVIKFLNIMFQSFKNIVQTHCEIKIHIQIYMD
jgi:hypothetical protein